MDPTLGRLNEAFCPNVISPIHDKAGVVTESSAHSGEAIRPLSTSASLSFEEYHWIVITRETNTNHASCALVPFDPPSMTNRPLFTCRLQRTCALYLLIRAALGALGLVTPSEESLFEPLE
jgi:hypothetical protein